jgi:membrane protein
MRSKRNIDPLGADGASGTAGYGGAGRTAGDGPARSRAEHPQPVGPDEGPTSPTKLSRRAWLAAGKRAVREFSTDAVSDWAAALTYYGILSIFPGLLVLVSALGLVGASTTDQVQGVVKQLAPGQVGEFLDQAIRQIRENTGAAGILAIVGILVAFWSASGYVGAFMRASNAIYDVPEGRPVWKTLPIRVGVTAGVGLMLIVSALIVVFTGNVAEQAGNAIGVGSTVVLIWGVAKWPVLLILVSLMFSLLYWASPNARSGGFRWITPGGVVAVVAWVIVSAGFAVYVANFASYNKTYGAIAGVIVFLVWLWLTNIAILFGAEVDAELERGRAIEVGHPEEKEPYLELRDDRNLKKGTDSGLG